MVEARNKNPEIDVVNCTFEDRGKEEILSDLLPNITRYLYKKTRNTWIAEDLAGQTTLKALEALPNYKDRGLPFSAWVFKIAHNEFISHLRQTKPTLSIYHNDGTVKSISSGGFEDDFLDKEVQRQQIQEIYPHMASLSNLQRQIITLRFFAGLSAKDTADLLGTSENYVRKAQSLGIAKLRKLTNIKAY